jgi:hypothetical protein
MTGKEKWKRLEKLARKHNVSIKRCTNLWGHDAWVREDHPQVIFFNRRGFSTRGWVWLRATFFHELKHIEDSKTKGWKFLLTNRASAEFRAVKASILATKTPSHRVNLWRTMQDWKFHNDEYREALARLKKSSIVRNFVKR